MHANTDFFTKYAVFMAFLGFGLFILFLFIALSFYPYPLVLTDDAFSDIGSIFTGSKAAGFFAAGMVIGGMSWIPVIMVYLREIFKNWRERKQGWALIGFLFQLLGRVFAILIGAFPSDPWGRIHSYIASMWLAGEVFGLIFIMIQMFQSKKELAWAIAPIALLAGAIFFWIPYIDETWGGIAIPEIASIIAIFSYSFALWIRAWYGKVAIETPSWLLRAPKKTDEAR